MSPFELGSSILFRQETGYWTVPPKEEMLYHWLKNQRVYMRMDVQVEILYRCNVK
jgi:hypothetical protein